MADLALAEPSNVVFATTVKTTLKSAHHLIPEGNYPKGHLKEIVRTFRLTKELVNRNRGREYLL